LIEKEDEADPEAEAKAAEGAYQKEEESESESESVLESISTSAGEVELDCWTSPQQQVKTPNVKSDKSKTSHRNPKHPQTATGRVTRDNCQQPTKWNEVRTRKSERTKDRHFLRSTVNPSSSFPVSTIASDPRRRGTDFFAPSNSVSTFSSFSSSSSQLSLICSCRWFGVEVTCRL